MSRIKINPKPSTIFINCRVHGSKLKPNNVRDLKLVLDTGATHTIVTQDAISGLGYEQDILHPIKRQPIITASDKIDRPVIKLSTFHSMGQIVKDFEVVIHDLPTYGHRTIQGLLGMDFLNRFDYRISFSKGFIEVYKPKRLDQNNRTRKKPRKKRKSKR